MRVGSKESDPGRSGKVLVPARGRLALEIDREEVAGGSFGEGLTVHGGRPAVPAIRFGGL
ncbi:hypothetical protein [Streptomyces sp. ML-6]|uniref:hypothetical protein n=1 Tax=Streptomyces sp. ML-6 TaxID=2982693 RepID=UPI0024C019D7|nr:hypothetical protein [Streptomyces sp. ML-6]MDK0519213.1 hypothetical protein [Streptomyces sp. ML-6]